MSVRAAQDYFLSKKWGVFTHYISPIQNNPDMPQSFGKSTSWQECTDELDVKKLAAALHKMGAGYYFFTVMQGTRYLAAPNAAYTKVTGTAPYPQRDLVMELYEALQPYGIDLCLYFTGDGPYKNEPEGGAFGLSEPRCHVSDAFVEKWAAVLREYAVRYGDRIKAWWIDGCPTDFLGYKEKHLKQYMDACLEGNPDALVAFNSGHVLGYTEADLTELAGDCCPENRAEMAALNASILLKEQALVCGEHTDFTYIPPERFLGRWKNAQAHILAPLGTDSCGIGASWGADGVQCSKEHLAAYVKRVNAIGGTVTVDAALYRDGSFSAAQTEVLEYVGKMCGR